MDPLAHCRDQLLEHHPDHHLAALFSPPAQRRATHGLLTALAEIRAIPRDCRDLSVAGTKLEWWRQECARLMAGAPRHPAMRCLLDSETLRAAPEWTALLEAVAHDVRYDAYPGDAELQDLARQLSSAEAALLARLDGNALEPTSQAARIEAGWLLNLHGNATRGRVYLPLDALARLGLDASVLQIPNPPPELHAEMRARAQRLRHALDAGDTGNGAPAPHILGRLTRQALQAFLRSDAPRWPRPASPWRRLFTAWNAARASHR